MKYYASGKALADEMKIDAATLKATFEDYNVNGEKQLKDPEGGPYNASPLPLGPARAARRDLCEQEPCILVRS